MTTHNLIQPRPSGANLRAARQLAGLSQTAAAQLIGVSMRTVQDWEADIAAMPLAAWALFLLATEQHDSYTVST